jgi:hypothetical protein
MLKQSGFLLIGFLCGLPAVLADTIQFKDNAAITGCILV